MVQAVRHRGPDESGFLVEGPVGLGHTRLSIIDLSTGTQPIHNEDKSIWVILNGEIFNYLELRNELLKKGHRFYTNTDTEVIVHSYEEKGIDCLHDFNGQFAFALWDGKNKKLILARDRVGICPLFYTIHKGKLIFASEVKSIFRYPGIPRRIDLKGLDQFFTFWTTIAPRTIFANISEIPAAAYMVVEKGACHTKQYWDMDFEPDDPPRNESYYVDRLNDLLLAATKIRLRSDVPVGVYLSGGLDSSFIASLVRHHTNNSLRTFSVSFSDQTFDESPFQRRMAKVLGTDHSTVVTDYADIGAVFPNVIWHTEKPTLRTAPAPLYQLSKLVRDNGYKVVLTGEGADEFLVGYNIYKEAKVRSFWARYPDSPWRPLLLRKLYPYIQLPRDNGAVFLRKFFGHRLMDVENPFYSHLIRWHNTSMLKGYFSNDVKNEIANYNCIEDFTQTVNGNLRQWDVVSKAQYIEAKAFLAGYLLNTQGDRMLMANSVEGRFPFLDHNVIEFCNKIPATLKLKALSEKNILKKAAKSQLPSEIVERTKQPYRAPISLSFLNHKNTDYVRDMLSPQRIEQADYFSSGSVHRLMKKAEKFGKNLGERDNMALVGILSTQLLHALFIDDYDHKQIVY